jgi:hypothetical protein
MKTKNMIEMLETASPVLEALSTLFVFVIGLLVLLIVVVFIFDITQRKNAVLRNYPVVGHFRSIFSSQTDSVTGSLEYCLVSSENEALFLICFKHKL